LQELIESEASAVIGADRYERTPERVTERNGVRWRELMTKAGPYPRILDTGCDYAAVGSVAARRAS
jgi:hypothetical protein